MSRARVRVIDLRSGRELCAFEIPAGMTYNFVADSAVSAEDGAGVEIRPPAGPAFDVFGPVCIQVNVLGV